LFAVGGLGGSRAKSRIPMMSDQPSRRSKRTSMPMVVWLLAGMLLIALFVLALGLLHSP